jgi:hypothetical protein
VVIRTARRLAPGDTLPIASLSTLSAAATLTAPALLAHPLLLVALTPRLPFLVLASGRTPLLVLLLVAVPRLCAADVFWFRIGRRLGPAALDRLPRRLRDLLDGAPRVRTVVLSGAILVRPVGRHLAAGAAAGLPPALVAALDVAGTLVFVLAVRFGTTAVLG